jgi:3-phenylpropionate/trans-cinnamate dioxygenase ferredoxin subunit
MSEYVKVAKATDIGPGQSRSIQVKDKLVAVFNVAGQFFALNNTCSHRGGSLAEGNVSGHEVTCPLHGARFDVRTGERLGPPAFQGVARYRIRVTGPDLEIEL